MHRVIIFGRIEYKNKRAITFARDEYVRHYETKAKGDGIFRPEEIFGEDLEIEITELHIEFTRRTHDAASKTLANGMSGLRTLLQFAIAGRVDMFVLEAGELPRQEVLEVKNDKTVVHAYSAGMEAFNEERYEDAIAPLTDAIGKFAAHPWAYNARGLAHFELGNIELAEADFKQARELYPALPSPHLGLAKIAHSRGQRAATIDNCARAMDGSMPHQPGYWICALFKTQVLLDALESGNVTDEAERNSYVNEIRRLTSRYSSKLHQLGSARNEYYPTPSELAKLQKRFEGVMSESSADA